MLITQNPFPQFFDTAGKPLTDGRIYFGVAGQNPRTSPAAIYTDAAGTQPIAQPVRTLGGYPVRNGSPVNIYTPGTYSVAVYAANGTLVAYAPDSAAFDSVLSATTAFTRSLLDDPDAATARATLGAVGLTGDETIAGVKTFASLPVLPGNASSALEAVPKQQAESIAATASAEQARTASALSFSGLALSATGKTQAVSVAAGELLLRAADGSPRLVSGVNVTISTATAGVNGLDTGTITGPEWYAVWVIHNGTTAAGLLSLSATAPTMPAGYTHRARVGYIRTDGSGGRLPLGFTQVGRRVQYRVDTTGNVPNLPQMATGTAGDTSAPAFATVAVGAFVPPTAGVIDVLARIGNNSSLLCAPNGQFGGVGSSANPAPMSLIINATTYGGVTRGSLVLESRNVFWACVGGGVLACVGWEDNL